MASGSGSSHRPYSAADVGQRSIVLDELIGKGSYGEVWLARWNGVRVAAKQIHSIFFENDYDQEVRDHYIREFKKEWEVLRTLDHPNIVKMLTVLFPHNKSPLILTELLHCDLEYYIKESLLIIPPRECMTLALGIAEGLKYLHTLKPAVVHRDLATKNILLTEQKHPKIADLGVAKVFASGKDMFATAVPGTPLYAAPETYPIIKGLEPVSEVKYGPKVDIFSFGAVVLAMVVGHEPVVWPFSPGLKDGSKISEAVRRKKDIADMGPHLLRQLVLECLKDKSKARPNAVSIVKRLHTLKGEMDACQNDVMGASTSGSMSDAGNPNTESSSKVDSSIPNVTFEKVPKQLNYDYVFKTLFIGNSGVGKSCLFQRSNNPAFNIEMVTSTVQPDIHYDQFLYDTKYVNMSIWDTAGQEKFFSIQPMNFRGAHGVFLVYDVTFEMSFKQLNRWINLARSYSGIGLRTPILLVGNKVDLPDKRAVTQERARHFAALNGFPYVETSAKDLDSIMNMYKKMIQMLIHSVDVNDIHLQVPVEQSQTRIRVAHSQKSKCPACKKS